MPARSTSSARTMALARSAANGFSQKIGMRALEAGPHQGRVGIGHGADDQCVGLGQQGLDGHDRGAGRVAARPAAASVAGSAMSSSSTSSIEASTCACALPIRPAPRSPILTSAPSLADAAGAVRPAALRRRRWPVLL